jgi:hypothetical protein
LAADTHPERNPLLPLQPDAPGPTSGACAHYHATRFDNDDTLELVSMLEFLAGWLDADLDYARSRLPLYGAYTVDDLRADTIRILHTIKQTNIQS